MGTVSNPVTWPEIEEALGFGGEARRAAEEHWKRACPPHCNPPFEESVGYCWTDLIACLLRAELWCLRQTATALILPAVAAVAARAHADRIRSVRERLEKEVYG